eukprot:CAMPEP_0197196608 /NCGR_PEP_ID=MMETSP1423-20130617/32445_1 /TAXON_ID=476441 /ORGANISM="Pseudo-nitzschia heimii, Strain UNC1101" /LENGTH=173 /DNA_ID=CAMNT_0042650415 /DNA_START=30 /DNA_END=551 /DNA_ORIENTATION=-
MTSFTLLSMIKALSMATLISANAANPSTPSPSMTVLPSLMPFADATPTVAPELDSFSPPDEPYSTPGADLAILDEGLGIGGSQTSESGNTHASVSENVEVYASAGFSAPPLIVVIIVVCCVLSCCKRKDDDATVVEQTIISRDLREWRERAHVPVPVHKATEKRTNADSFLGI